MRVLVLNGGSSSLKLKLVEVSPALPRQPVMRPEAWGLVENIGGRARLHLATSGSAERRAEQVIADHEQAVQWVFEALGSQAIDAVGHRVVHGGERFREPVRIDGLAMAEIERLSDLAPLHNPACIAGIVGARAHLGESVPMVAVFDTAFHATLPPYAAIYAIPEDLARKHGIRRYGFHGIAHASLAAAYAESVGRRLEDTRLITLQLGNGCSATAIDRGRSVDTSMGFTPLEGLVMGTRSGDLDPSIVAHLARWEALPVEEVERWLNERSGLLGVSGLSHDMATLLAAEKQDHPRAKRAIDLFCYRARKYIGAYLAALGGADAIVFGGGIGERAPEIRARICFGMEWCGLRLDHDRNAAVVGLPPGAAARISQDGAGLAAHVVAVDEETEIVRQTVRCLFGVSA